MKYLNCVMNETKLRMPFFRYEHAECTKAYRIIPDNISQLRDCINDTVVPLGGGPVASHQCSFEREILVLVNKNVMYRNTEYWRDVVDIYRPDRFDGHHGSWHFLPFGGGPH
ncbi:cytochrome P450 monooxygenase tenA [Colletotrichum liriopes]|uniref:Cytochrome P450 monooxygenase tenA n=1 Tax=Colletotrichum liriopes TaxID=708192 RepID=A0AA37GVA1_9PEZI|nr:cytochrome P450 monooxygenase tenA [Colletotrichum liriopes]